MTTKALKKTDLEFIIYNKTTKNKLSIVWLSVALCFLFLLSLFIGSSQISFNEIINSITTFIVPWDTNLTYSDSSYTILFYLRIPRSLLVILTGIILSASGTGFQAIFKNPLADPYLLGVGTGAGLGAILGLTIFNINFIFANLNAAVFAFAGGVFAVFSTFVLSNYSKTNNQLSLILAGVAVTSLFGALTTLLLITQDPDIKPMLSWLLGGFSLSSWENFNIVFIFGFPSLIIIFLMSEKINLLNLDSELISNLGINEGHSIKVLIMLSTLATSVAVSQTGIIGFIGLVAPHISRMKWGSNAKYLLPQSSLIGAIILLSSDMIAKTIMSPIEIPVGLITAFLGFPFFVSLLRKESGKNWKI